MLKMKILSLKMLPILVVSAIAVALTAAWAKSWEPVDACVGNERLLIQAMQQYLQDNDNIFPLMNTQAEFQSALSPYVQNPQTFICPDTGQAYVPNSYYSYRQLQSIADISAQPIFEDAVAHEGHKAFAYFDDVVTRGEVVMGNTNEECVSNLRAVSLGMLQYVQDYDETFPLMDTPTHFRDALMPYVRDRRDFICPATNAWYRPNAALSYKTLAWINNPSTTWLVADERPHANGLKAIAYVDGHVDQGGVNKGNFFSTTQTCYDNVRELNLAVLQYTQDNDEMLPPTDTLAHFEAALAPYVGGDNSLFICPDNNAPYVLNPAVGGESIALIANPSTTVILQDPGYNLDGTFNTLYVDGHVGQTSAYLARSFALAGDDTSRLMWGGTNSDAFVQSLSSTGPSIGGTFLDATYPLTPSTINVDSVGNSGLLWTAYVPQLWTLSLTDSPINKVSYGPYDGWTLLNDSVGPDHVTRLLWEDWQGRASVWTTDSTGAYVTDTKVGPIAGMTATGFVVGGDNEPRVLWTGASGAAVSTLQTNGKFNTDYYPQVSNYSPIELTTDSANHTHILWAGHAGQVVLQRISSAGVVSEISMRAPGSYTAIGGALGADGDARFLFRTRTATARLYIVNSAGAIISQTDYPTPAPVI